MNSSFVLAFSTLVGTIVGAGIFGLPYALAKSGIIPGLFYFIVLGCVVTLLHLMLGEIALRTKEKHRLIGYASFYLGAWAKKIVTVSTIVGIVGALLAYIIIGGNFLHIVFGSFVPLSSFAFALVFWFVLSFFILWSIQTIAKMELFMNIVLFVIFGVIFVFAFPHMDAQNFPLIDSSHLFLPYGVVLFAFWGLSAIPEIAELFKNKKERKRLDNLIVWASLISGAFFLLFALSVVGVSGVQTSQDALGGLISSLGGKVVVFGALFGLVVIADSFLVLGNYLKNSLCYDYKIPWGISAAVAIFSPIILFLLGLRQFIFVIGVAGAVVAALEGVLVILIWRKAKEKGNREPEYSFRIPRFILFAVTALLILGAIFGFSEGF